MKKQDNPTIEETLANGWTIEAEYDGEKYHVYIKSPCNDYCSSLTLVEDMGVVENHQTLATKRVPESVIDAAEKLDDSLFIED